MKHTHTEGPGSILKSRFARGLLPLMVALLACALAAGIAQTPTYEAELTAARLHYEQAVLENQRLRMELAAVSRLSAAP